MADQFNVLVICGSLRKGSYNAALTRALPGLAPPGMKFVTAPAFETLPLYNGDMQEVSGFPGPAQDLAAAVRAADGVLFVTPEYNWSMPGGLKNAIDWVSRPYGDNAWQGKPVAVMGASIGMLGSARAQYHLRQSFVFLNMYPVNQPEVMIANASQRFNERGELTDETSRELIRKLLAELVAWTTRLKG